jgi:hypothetical protein
MIYWVSKGSYALRFVKTLAVMLVGLTIMACIAGLAIYLDSVLGHYMGLGIVLGLFIIGGAAWIASE